MCDMFKKNSYLKMQQSIDTIYNTIKDYRNDDGIFISKDHIRDWALQFGNDATFVLREFAHIIRQVYISKNQGYQYLEAVLSFLQKEYNACGLEQLLQTTCFLRLQPSGKSQHVLVDMLDEMVYAKIKKHICDYDDYPHKHYIYLDDILASGKTVADDLIAWIGQGKRLDDLKNKNIDLKLIVICRHQLGMDLQMFRISKTFNDVDSYPIIDIRSCYVIENNPTAYKPKLNIAMPIKANLSQEAMLYLDQLQADEKYMKYGFRSEGKPVKESFFTSPTNRDKYEQILVNKGLEILANTGVVGSYTRPLGIVNPKYKTLGMGTHFFTWRNVPNNCPIVYWWEVPGCGWKPLFPKK